jgi:hypothetical protein
MADSGIGGMGGAAVGGQVISGLAGVIAYMVESGDIEKANSIMAEARRKGGVSVPNLQAAIFEALGPSELARIQADPQYEAIQRESVGQLSDIISNGGRSLATDANRARDRSQSAQQEQASQAALREQFASRGVAGSGAEMALQQAASQQAANRQSQTDLDSAGQDQQAYMDAIRERAGMASGFRDQAWNEKGRAATANDTIKRFNSTEERATVGQNNAAEQAHYKMEAAEKDKKYQMAKDEAEEKRREAERTRKAIQGIGDAAGGAVGASGGL